MLLQHRINEYQRKAEQENEKRRNVENEGKLFLTFLWNSCLFNKHSFFCHEKNKLSAYCNFQPQS